VHEGHLGLDDVDLEGRFVGHGDGGAVHFVLPEDTDVADADEDDALLETASILTLGSGMVAAEFGERTCHRALAAASNTTGMSLTKSGMVSACMLTPPGRFSPVRMRLPPKSTRPARISVA